MNVVMVLFVHLTKDVGLGLMDAVDRRREEGIIFGRHHHQEVLAATKGTRLRIQGPPRHILQLGTLLEDLFLPNEETITTNLHGQQADLLPWKNPKIGDLKILKTQSDDMSDNKIRPFV